MSEIPDDDSRGAMNAQGDSGLDPMMSVNVRPTNFRCSLEKHLAIGLPKRWLSRSGTARSLRFNYDENCDGRCGQKLRQAVIF